MLSTSLRFRQLAAGHVRPLSWAFRASFDKAFDPSVTYFELDSSVLDGIDILAADEDTDVITEWSKYIYENYDRRVIGLEWTSELDFFSSITASMADISLNNYDGFFTRGGESPLAPYLLPRRPIKILAGFGGEVLPQFIGLTEKAPVVDRIGRTASLHAEDFLTFIFAKRLDQSQLFLDKRVDEILEELFDLAGVIPSQMQLDIARTTVPYAFFDKNTTIGYAVGELMKAEMGSLYMDETGIIIFRNRLRQSTGSVYTFNEQNIIDYDNSDESKIVNSVSVKAEVREVQPLQVIFNLSEKIFIPGGETVSRFFQFNDPVTSVADIIAYTANSEEDGSGTDLSGVVNIVSQTLFSNTLLVEMENTGSVDAYMTGMTIDGTPVKIARKVDVIEKDQTSIDEFEEQTLEIASPYIQDESQAESIALTIVRHFKDYGNTITMNVKGTPAVQLGDVVLVQIDDIDDTFIIQKQEKQIINSRFGHRITAQKYDIPTYFQLDVSTLDSEDELAA